MGLLVALHLGVVFGLFVTLPYGKFVHGLYRYAALARYARERARAAGEQAH
jgi:citrate/tricarballylate utilization protein